MEPMYIVNYLKLNPFGDDLELTERLTESYLITLMKDKGTLVLSATLESRPGYENVHK
ncbi:MAG: hypothetical protein K6A69_02570 [Lachnospiraceae bacterium]|nr:hypothetical protein [Lachnospiraceae bacterium]